MHSADQCDTLRGHGRFRPYLRNASSRTDPASQIRTPKESFDTQLVAQRDRVPPHGSRRSSCDVRCRRARDYLLVLIPRCTNVFTRFAIQSTFSSALDGDERKVLDSRPFQRLRHVHQLALTHLVYPGATHKRFEHSLGVMELAGRVFDIVTNTDNVTDEIKHLLEPLTNPDHLAYWRRVLRMAALCHDVGHLPFSHAAEQELLPTGWDHERFTRDIISSSEMQAIWSAVTPPLRPDNIIKLAIGPKKARDLDFSDWEAILSEIVVGDAFGVDRMDYLLRDSHHAGVAYGRFDHYRLIDTLRILTIGNHGSQEPALGVEEGGIQSAEALMLARYFMYSQVYFHPVRRIYNIHLMDFLKEWLDEGAFSTDTN